MTLVQVTVAGLASRPFRCSRGPGRCGRGGRLGSPCRTPAATAAATPAVVAGSAIIGRGRRERHVFAGAGVAVRRSCCGSWIWAGRRSVWNWWRPVGSSRAGREESCVLSPDSARCCRDISVFILFLPARAASHACDHLLLSGGTAGFPFSANFLGRCPGREADRPVTGNRAQLPAGPGEPGRDGPDRNPQGLCRGLLVQAPTQAELDDLAVRSARLAPALVARGVGGDGPATRAIGSRFGMDPCRSVRRLRREPSVPRPRGPFGYRALRLCRPGCARRPHRPRSHASGPHRPRRRHSGRCGTTRLAVDHRTTALAFSRRHADLRLGTGVGCMAPAGVSSVSTEYFLSLEFAGDAAARVCAGASLACGGCHAWQLWPDVERQSGLLKQPSPCQWTTGGQSTPADHPATRPQHRARE